MGKKVKKGGSKKAKKAKKEKGAKGGSQLPPEQVSTLLTFLS
jgi:hypothetical protein